MPDFELAHKIASSWTSALLEECLERFGPEEGKLVFLCTISGGFWCALTNFGAEQASASLNSMLRGSGITDWQMVRVS
jgi:hypothetical protein